MALLVETWYFLFDWRWLTTGLVFLLSYHVARFYSKVSKYPKGPFPLPIVGNLLTIMFVKKLHLKAREWAKIHGDPFTMWMGERPMVVLTSNRVVREAFIENKHHFSGRNQTKLGALETQGSHDVVFEDYNPTWKVLRKVIWSAVRKYSVIESLENICHDVVDAYVDTLEDGPQVVDSRDPLMYIIFNVLGGSVYGAKFERNSPDMETLQKVNDDFLEVAPNGLPSDIVPWLGILFRNREKKVEEAFKHFFDILDRIYQKAKTEYVPGTLKTFTHCILAARDEAIENDKSDAQYLTEGNMVQMLLDIFLAGTDSTLGELQWLLLTMTQQPSIQERMQKEIDDNIGSAPPTLKDKDKLPYTFACLLETIRFYPVVPFGLPHKTTGDAHAGGRGIPKDTCILYNIYNVNHDPDLWEDPDVFRPERFLDAATGRLRQDDQAQSLTFGIGPRLCPGEKLAYVDMFYVVVRLMQHLTCSAPTNSPSGEVLASDSSLFLIPKKQNICFTRRQ